MNENIEAISMQQLCMFIKGSTPSVPPEQGQIGPDAGS